MSTASHYQVEVFNHCKNFPNKSLIVQARAGSGKTWTLCQSLQHLTGDILALCFNKKPAAELASKISTMKLPNVVVSTFHAMGNTILRNGKKFGPQLDGDKVKKIFLEVAGRSANEEMQSLLPFVLRLVALSKDHAFGCDGQPDIRDEQAWQTLCDHHDIICDLDSISQEEAIQICMDILEISNRDRGVIDFADMIYHPVLFQVNCKKYSTILVDEAQDTNPCRRLLVRLMIVDSGKTIWVGDDKQAIYGFTGADADAMEKIKEEFSCDTLPLSICYRCGSSIIAEAQKIVPDIEAWEGAGVGEVKTTTYESFLDAIPDMNLGQHDGIICRNNAPLVPLAFYLIRLGIPAQIEGKNEICSYLVKYLFKWKDRGLSNFIELFERCIEREIEKMEEKKNMPRVGQLEDIKDTMMAFVARAQFLGINNVISKRVGKWGNPSAPAALQDVIEEMFVNSDGQTVPGVILSSVHKSKGLEFDRCMVLGRAQFMPSKYAVKPWQTVQEMNLEYVSITRAKNELIFVEEVPTGRRKENA